MHSISLIYIMGHTHCPNYNVSITVMTHAGGPELHAITCSIWALHSCRMPSCTSFSAGRGSASAATDAFALKPPAPHQQQEKNVFCSGLLIVQLSDMRCSTPNKHAHTCNSRSQCTQQVIIQHLIVCHNIPFLWTFSVWTSC